MVLGVSGFSVQLYYHLFVWILFPPQFSYNLSTFYFVSPFLGWFIHLLFLMVVEI